MSKKHKTKKILIWKIGTEGNLATEGELKRFCKAQVVLKVVNDMKGALSQEDFIKFCGLVTDYTRQEELYANPS